MWAQWRMRGDALPWAACWRNVCGIRNAVLAVASGCESRLPADHGPWDGKQTAEFVAVLWGRFEWKDLAGFAFLNEPAPLPLFEDGSVNASPAFPGRIAGKEP